MAAEIVVIAEKYLMARALAHALLRGGTANNGMFLGQTDRGTTLIAAADGHILGLAEPQHYNPEWRERKLEHLPIFPPEMNFALEPRDEDKLRTISHHLNNATHVVNACDAAREGELIFDEIARWCALYRRRVTMERMWIEDTTVAGLRRSWNGLRQHESKALRRLREQARTRAESDWLWGINGTRYVRLALSATLGPIANAFSVGRVRTPVLGMISERCHDVHEHTPERFFQAVLRFANEQGATCEAKLLAPPHLKFGARDADWGDWAELVERIEHIRLVGGQPWRVIEGDNRQANEYPPAPFDLTDLQRTANRLLGWTARHTERIAQSLYARYHAISYPRTDCYHLPETMRDDVMRLWRYYRTTWLSAAYRDIYAEIPDWPPDPQNVFVERVSDHHAIIPTGEAPPAKDVTTGAVTDEYLLWDLIVRRFITAWMPPAQVFASSRVFSLPYRAGEEFRALIKAAPVTDPGWLVFEDLAGTTRGWERKLTDRLQDQLLPPMGAQASFVQASPFTLHTHAPELFTYDTLLDRMDRAGLGTVATRGAIMEELKDEGSVAEDSHRRLVITPEGEKFVAILRAHGGDQLLDTKLTAFWEKQLQAIGKPAPNGRTRESVLTDVVTQVRDIGCKLTAPADVQDVVFCPRTGLLVNASEDGWTFPGYPNVRCPRQILDRIMRPSEYRDIFAAGRKGGGPFDGFVSKRSGEPFRAWLRYDKDTGRFKFLFKRRAG